MKLSQQTIDMLKEQGYSDLDDYLMSLSTDQRVPVIWVVSLAEISGENERFDGLPYCLESYTEDMY